MFRDRLRTKHTVVAFHPTDEPYAIDDRLRDIDRPSDAAATARTLWTDLTEFLPINFVSEMAIHLVSFELAPDGLDSDELPTTPENYLYEAATRGRRYIPRGIVPLIPASTWRPTFREQFETPITPMLDPLRVVVPCKSSRHSDAAKHLVLIHSDGRVEASHDLAAEAVAQAFGGYATCLVFARDVVPAMLNELPVLLRHELPSLRFGRRGGNDIADKLQCCSYFMHRSGPTSFNDLARHLRDEEHLAEKYRIPRTLVGMFLDALDQAWSGLNTLPAGSWDAATEWMRFPNELQYLWDSGIHPSDIPRYAQGLESSEPTLASLGHGLYTGDQIAGAAIRSAESGRVNLPFHARSTSRIMDACPTCATETPPRAT